MWEPSRQSLKCACRQVLLVQSLSRQTTLLKRRSQELNCNHTLRCWLVVIVSGTTCKLLTIRNSLTTRKLDWQRSNSTLSGCSNSKLYNSKCRKIAIKSWMNWPRMKGCYTVNHLWLMEESSTVSIGNNSTVQKTQTHQSTIYLCCLTKTKDGS